MQIRDLAPGEAFIWRAKRYVLEAQGMCGIPGHQYARCGKQVAHFLDGQEVQASN